MQPAGWYPDPWDSTQLLRWWDGSEWTGHTQPVLRQPRQGGWLGQMLSPTSTEEYLARFHMAAPGTPHDEVSRAGSTSWSNQVVPALMLVLVAVMFRLPEAGGMFLLAGSVFALGSGGFLVYRTTNDVRRWAQLSDLPTSAPVSAHVGRNELFGTARPSTAPVVSWMTGTPATWWHCKVEEYRSDGDNSSWVTVAERSHHTGWAALCDADGGEVLVDLAAWTPQLLQACPSTRLQPQGASTLGTRSVRATEHVLVPDSPLTVVGDVGIVTGSRLQVSPATSGGVAVADPGHAERLARARALRGVVAAGVGFAAVVSMLPAPALVATVATSVLGLFAASVWWTWARLVAVRERVAGSWSVIETFAQRRHDVVPALASTAAAAAAHERAVQVAAARVPPPDLAASTDAMLLSDSAPSAQVRAQVEAHPELRTHAAYAALFDELVRCENQLAGARTTYNEALQIAADRRSTFPVSLLAARAIPSLPPYLTWQ